MPLWIDFPIFIFALTPRDSQQPWSTYALHFATFTSLAFVVDPLLLYSCWRATGDWDPVSRENALWAQFLFMFGFTKVVKLMGLFLRNPSDIKYLIVSVVFGYFHGLIKVYALFTLRMVRYRPPSTPDEWQKIGHSKLTHLVWIRRLGAAAKVAIRTTTSG